MSKYIQPSVKILHNTPTNLGYELWCESRETITKYNSDGSFWLGTELIIPDNNDHIDRDHYKQLFETTIRKSDKDSFKVRTQSNYFDRISKMSLQYNNFPYFVFEVNGSILFRDVLYNINKASQWAVSLRFVHSVFTDFDPQNYKVSAEYEGVDIWEDQLEVFLKGVQDDMTTDNNRLKMPCSIHSKYWVGMNLKTLLGFIPMLKNEMPFFYEVYGKLFEDALMEYYPNIKNYYSERNDPSIYQYFSRDEDFKEGYQEVDDLVIFKMRMGPLLFSQFIRQSDVIVKGFYNELKHSDPNDFLTNKLFSSQTPYNITLICDKAKWNENIKKRSCWFSMSGKNDINSWSRVLDVVLKDINLDQFKELLPCIWEGNKCTTCPFFDDVKFRIEGLEVKNLPCGLCTNDLEVTKKRHLNDQTILSENYVLLAEAQNASHPNYSLYNELIKNEI